MILQKFFICGEKWFRKKNCNWFVSIFYISTMQIGMLWNSHWVQENGNFGFKIHFPFSQGIRYLTPPKKKEKLMSFSLRKMKIFSQIVKIRQATTIFRFFGSCSRKDLKSFTSSLLSGLVQLLDWSAINYYNSWKKRAFSTYQRLWLQISTFLISQAKTAFCCFLDGI